MKINQNTPNSAFEIEGINPEDFIISSAVQIRIASKKHPDGLDLERVEQYARDMISGAKFPNIQAVRSQVQQGKFLVYDGFNRIAALKKARAMIQNSFNNEGWNDITKEPVLNATILEGKFSLHELRFMAFRANKVHGLALSFQERTEGFNAFIKAKLFLTSFNRVMSLNEIGREFGITGQAVAARLKKNKDFKQIYGAFFSKEAEGFPRWEGGLNKHQHNGGLTDMEKNLATVSREFFEQQEQRVKEYEALGGSPVKAELFRGMFHDHQKLWNERLAAVGIVEPRQDF